MIRRFCISLAAWLFALSPLCRGDLVMYGDFETDNLFFIDVIEISEDPLPLYGLPSVAVNGLDFVAPGFSSQSQAGGVDFVNGRVRFTVAAKPGFLIDSISVDGFGSYFAFGAGSQVFTGATPFVQIGNDLFPGAYTFGSSANSNGAWSENLVINFPASQQVTFVMDNSLFTAAGGNGAAFISDQGISIRAAVSAVPEPATTLLLVLGSVAGFIIWRRNATHGQSTLRHT